MFIPSKETSNCLAVTQRTRVSPFYGSLMSLWKLKWQYPRVAEEAHLEVPHRRNGCDFFDNPVSQVAHCNFKGAWRPVEYWDIWVALIMPIAEGIFDTPKKEK